MLSGPSSRPLRILAGGICQGRVYFVRKVGLGPTARSQACSCLRMDLERKRWVAGERICRTSGTSQEEGQEKECACGRGRRLAAHAWQLQP